MFYPILSYSQRIIHYVLYNVPVYIYVYIHIYIYIHIPTHMLLWRKIRQRRGIRSVCMGKGIAILNKVARERISEKV